MPKSKLSTAQRNNTPSTPTTTNTDSTADNEPSWDTSPNTFPAYLAALKRWINKQDERFKPLIEYGYVNIKGTIYCMSDTTLLPEVERTISINLPFMTHVLNQNPPHNHLDTS